MLFDVTAYFKMADKKKKNFEFFTKMSQNLAMYKQKTGFFTKNSEALELKTSIFRISIKFWFRKHPQTFWPRRLNKTPVALDLLRNLTATLSCERFYLTFVHFLFNSSSQPVRHCFFTLLHLY